MNLSSSSSSPPFSEPKVVTPRIVGGKSVLTLALDAEMTQWAYQCEGETSYAQIPIYNQDVPGPTMLLIVISTVKSVQFGFPGSGDADGRRQRLS